MVLAIVSANSDNEDFKKVAAVGFGKGSGTVLAKPIESQDTTVSNTTFASKLGEWKQLQANYPFGVFEAGGGVLNVTKNRWDFIVMGGFKGFPNATSDMYSIQVDPGMVNGKNKWVKRSAMPDPLTHMAQTVDGQYFYGVGGYLGSHPGKSSKSAWRYDIENDTWSRLPNIPERRAGGGLILVFKRYLIYTSGVDRPENSMAIHNDKPDTWRLDLENLENGWTDDFAPIAKPRNHMGAVASCGRFFFVGGQEGSNEHTGNLVNVDEYDPIKKKWVNGVAQLPEKVGHISASVMPYKCGILVVGGFGQERAKRSDVLWWDPQENKWLIIGQFPTQVATPVCGLLYSRLTCGTGEATRMNEVFTTFLKI